MDDLQHKRALKCVLLTKKVCTEANCNADFVSNYVHTYTFSPSIQRQQSPSGSPKSTVTSKNYQPMKNKIVTVTLTVVLRVQTNKFFVFSPFCLPICCKKEPNHCISQNTTSLRKIGTIRSGELDSEMASKIQEQGAKWRLVFKNIAQAWC